MSTINDYLIKNLGILELRNELRRLIKEYNSYTGRYLFVYASDFTKGRIGIDVSLMQDDFYTIQDILRESKKDVLDFYIETPGGSGETAEEIAKFLHKKFKEVNFVIAGEAKSAGTILALSGDNIYMCETGSLGPIDAQVRIGRMTISAHDYVSWVEDKRKEAEKTGRLSPFDATMIAQISPGEIYGVINSLEFAKDLVKKWLVDYKFKNWNVTETTKKTVTYEMKRKRAEEIADKLCNHMTWKTHGRSLKIEDLKDLLRITDIDKDPVLANIVYRIKTVIRLIFDTSTDYKLFFLEDFNLSRTATASNPDSHAFNSDIKSKEINGLKIEIRCPKCGKQHAVQAYVGTERNEGMINKLKSPNVRGNDVLVCDNIGCNMNIDLKPIKNQIESQIRKRIFFK